MELGLSLGYGRREEEEEEEAEEEEMMEDMEEERSSGEPPVHLSLGSFAWTADNSKLISYSSPAFKDLQIDTCSSRGGGGRQWQFGGLRRAGIRREPGPVRRGCRGRVPQQHRLLVPDGLLRDRHRRRGVGGGEAAERASSARASDEEENGAARKKLRLSKEQSAFLEESFKEHHTLNPKQKVALAKQLNLRPRQVEVWFQNRRARTKLKQTEVDCEYLKRCCETLTEENRRLQKELSELRALKTTAHPFFMQLPATTLSMCPSCERTTTTTTTAANAAAANAGGSGSKQASSFASLFRKKPRFFPFVSSSHPATSPAS
ncbi:uncharacterized protein M6B38_126980 [Iris pallida]|uniref:Homeobox domain-containing protein n=1 Tax=Iris pallida TaxID=29817 RepID=A0AAX6GFF2_IRIPA|nr:uncharacterized protein M6B38_126980 [Iris pallida]